MIRVEGMSLDTVEWTTISSRVGVVDRAFH
jgi:hypothetical protein